MSLSCLRTMRPILLALAIVAALLVSTSALPPPSAAKRNAPPQTTAVVHPGHILARLSERLTRFASSLQLPFQNRGARTHTPPSVGVHRKDSTAVAIAAVERPWSAPTFFHDFSRGMDYSRFFFAGLWANGQPFNTGWNPKLGYVDRDGKLALTSKRMDFHDWSATGGGNGKWYKYSSAEIRSWSFYGAGCYSVCMKPSGQSGISSSFYIQAGKYDRPNDVHNPRDLHNEIDIEFVGKDTHKVQTNFFSRWKNPHGNSGSGFERMHYLGFDASKQYAAYSFKWTDNHIAYFVNGKMIRLVWSHEAHIPSPRFTTMRMAANVWPVNKQAEEWAGPLDPNFSYADAKYAWMAFEQGSNCRVRSSC